MRDIIAKACSSEIEGQGTIVTGGASGIGRAIADACAARGRSRGRRRSQRGRRA